MVVESLDFRQVELVRDAALDLEGVSLLSGDEYDLLFSLSEGESLGVFGLHTYRKLLNFFIMNGDCFEPPSEVDLLKEILKINNELFAIRNLQ